MSVLDYRMMTTTRSAVYTIVLASGLLAACRQSAVPQAAIPRDTETITSESIVSAKYADGQRVKLGNKVVSIGLHECDSKKGCQYLVYFVDDTAQAVAEKREIKNEWVREQELGEVVPVYEIGQRVYLLSDRRSNGHITRATCSSGRCRYVVHYSDSNGIFRDMLAEEFELGACLADSAGKCL